MAPPDRFTPLPEWSTREAEGVGATLGSHALAVYTVMLAFRQRFTKASGQTGALARKAKASQRFYCSLPQIARAAGVSRATAHRSLRKLRDAGLVEVLVRGARGAANSYLVHDRPQVVSAGHYPSVRSITGTCPPSPIETRSYQAETPERKKSRADSQRDRTQRGDARGEAPGVNSFQNGKPKDPVEQYRALARIVGHDPKALKGLLKDMELKLGISELEARALLEQVAPA